MKKILVLVGLSCAFFFGCGDDGDDSKKVDDDTCVSVYCDESGLLEQPAIGVRDGSGKTVITVDGYQFKDSNGNGSLDAYEDWRLSPFERAKALVVQEEFTVEQKVGMMDSALGILMGDGDIDSSMYVYFTEGKTIGHMTFPEALALGKRYFMSAFGGTKPESVAKFMNGIQAFCEAQPMGIPAVGWSDPNSFHSSAVNEGGNYSIWPRPLGFAAINDVSVTRAYADALRQEYLAVGVRGQLGPMADLFTDPRWPRGNDTFGASAHVVANNVEAVVKGFQNDGDLVNGIISVIKHFPGHGAMKNGEDPHMGTGYGQWLDYPGDNFYYHTIPFQRAFEAGAAAVMPCYSVFAGVDPELVGSGYSEYIITDLLKEQMGFSGMVTGDWGVTGKFAFGLESFTIAEKGEKWLTAGSHQFGYDDSQAFLAAYQEGLVDEEQINQAVAKILEVTFKLGVFENPYVDEATAVDKCYTNEMKEAALNAMRDSMVLLKNSDVLPLSTGSSDQNSDGSLLVYYDGIDDGVAALGDYIPAANVTTDLSVADYAIIRIQSTGELSPNNSLEYVTLPDSLQDAIDARNAGNSELKLIVVMYMKNPTIVEDFLDEMDAFIVEFGSKDEAVLDGLFRANGFENFKGTLPVEIPSSMEAVEKQYCDVPNDSDDPTFRVGVGLTY